MSTDSYQYFRNLSKDGERHRSLLIAGRDFESNVEIFKYSLSSLEETEQALLARIAALEVAEDELNTRLERALGERDHLKREYISIADICDAIKKSGSWKFIRLLRSQRRRIDRIQKLSSDASIRAGLPNTRVAPQLDEGHSPKELKDFLRFALEELSVLNPRVTVVIPCYNYGAFVTEAVNSVLAQSYPNVDVVVVDDGSTDRHTQKVLKKLARDRVRVHHQTNKGLSAARNAGAGLTSSEFVVFLDADDRLHPSAITLMLWSLLRHPDRSYVYTSQRFFGDDNLIWDPQAYNGYDLLWSNHPSVCSLIRRSAFESVKGYSVGMVVGYEDWNHWVMLLDAGHIGLRLRAPLFQHRRHGHTMTHDAHNHSRLLHKKIRGHSSSLYTATKISNLKRDWRPSVSVIIPHYNSEKFIHETILSLKNQTSNDFEVIIIDDGSSSEAAIETLKNIESSAGSLQFPLRVVWADHHGLPTARNRGVLEARAEYIFFLDSDDLIDPTNIEKLVIFAAINKEASFVYSAVRHFGTINAIASDTFDSERLKRENFLTASCLIRRSDYLEIGGMDEALINNYEDYDFWLRLISEGHFGVLLPEPLFSYRRHERGNRTNLENKATPQEMYAALHARHPKLFGGVEPNRDSWKLLGRSVGDEMSRVESMAAAIYGSGVPRDSYRRSNLPNMFDPARWESDKPHILYILPFFVCGGAERVDLDILVGLKRDGFNITIVATEADTNEWLDQFRAISEDLFILPNMSANQSTQDKVLDYLMVSRAIDVVFIRNSAAGYRLAERWSSITDQIKFADLLHVHADGQDWVRQSAIYNDLLEKRFVISNDLKDYSCDTYSLDRDRFQVIYNGVDVSIDQSAKEYASRKQKLCDEVGLDVSHSLIAFCGRISDQKDPMRWLRVMKRAMDAKPDIRGIVIGDGDLNSQMRNGAEKLGIAGKLKFLGYRQDAVSILGGCDVLLMTSKYEGLPMVMIEALSQGVPVVCTDVGGTREGMTEQVGLMLDIAASDDAYADAVIRVLDRLQTEPGMGENCRNLVAQRFDVERQRSEYALALRSLAHSTNRKMRFDAYLEQMMMQTFMW